MKYFHHLDNRNIAQQCAKTGWYCIGTTERRSSWKVWKVYNAMTRNPGRVRELCKTVTPETDQSQRWPRCLELPYSWLATTTWQKTTTSSWGKTAPLQIRRPLMQELRTWSIPTISPTSPNSTFLNNTMYGIFPAFTKVLYTIHWHIWISNVEVLWFNAFRIFPLKAKIYNVFF